MSTTKEPPAPFPPAPPAEPFLLLRPPPGGTLVGLAPPAPVAAVAAPPLPPLPPDRAALASGPRALRKRLVLAREAPELEQLLEGLRVELVYWRAWWGTDGPGPVRRRRRQALALGIALGLVLGLGGAWSWPAVARIARLSAPPAASAQR